MMELAAERAEVKRVLADMGIDAWVYEHDAGARPGSIEDEYLSALEAAELFVGIYWKGYGTYTNEEFAAARERGRQCFLYEKLAAPNERDSALEGFLGPLRDVRTGLALKRFASAAELGTAVRRDLVRWLSARAPRSTAGSANAAPLYLADHHEQKKLLDPLLKRAELLFVLSHGRSEQAHRTLSSYCYNKARAADPRLRDIQTIRWPPAGHDDDRFDALCESILGALDALDERVPRRGTVREDVIRRLSKRSDRPCFRQQLPSPAAADLRLLDRSLAELWAPVSASGTPLLVVFELVHSAWWFWNSPSWRTVRGGVTRLQTRVAEIGGLAGVPPRIRDLSHSDVTRISASVHGSGPGAVELARDAYGRHHGRVGPTLMEIYGLEDEV